MTEWDAHLASHKEDQMGDGNEYPEEPQEAPSRCYFGGGAANHAWEVYSNGDLKQVGCRDCPAQLTAEELLETWYEHERVVQVGISVLQGELEQHREDLKEAASMAAVDPEEAPPGSKMRRLLISNRLCSHMRDEAIADSHLMRRAIGEALAALGGLAASENREDRWRVERIAEIAEILETAIASTDR